MSHRGCDEVMTKSDYELTLLVYLTMAAVEARVVSLRT